jgi:serine protease Do
LSQPGGALVGEVSPDTPAARAGIKRGDVILQLNGQPVTSANDLRLHISQMAPGTNVKLQISRDGKTQDVSLALGELPEKAEAAKASEAGSGGLDGVDVQELTPDIAEQLQLAPGTRGVVVSNVDPASAAAAAELQRGDVIQEVNHKPVANIEQYKQALATAGKQSVLLLVNHQGVTGYMVIEPR